MMVTKDETTKKAGSKLFNSDLTIGELNGKWAWLLKVCLISVTAIAPLFLGWAIWVTTAVFQWEFSSTAFADTHNEIRALVNENKKSSKDNQISIDSLEKAFYASSPEELKRRIGVVESSISQLGRENNKEHTDILLILEKIKANQESKNVN